MVCSVQDMGFACRRNKNRGTLTLKDSPREAVDLDVIDTPTSWLFSVVCQAAGNPAEFVMDTLSITGPDRARIAKVSERASGSRTTR